MKIQKRRVNSQDHTIGYKIGGKWYTRRQAIDLAMDGRVDRVSVCGSGNTQHLRGTEGMKLYDLKTQMV
jgi:hypothetical protein